jgi:1-acyl-sn-glycerol-3-phosphate acyltransferase
VSVNKQSDMQNSGYNHARWERQRLFLRFLLRDIVFKTMIKLDLVEGVENVPSEGPAVLVINHIAFVDPIVMVHVVPRNIVPLAKIEVYDYPVIGIFPRWWGGITVRREEMDRQAVRQAMDVLRAGEIILVAPEGTRSPKLMQAKEGFAYFASRSAAPVVPIAIEGSESYPTYPLSSSWRRQGVSVRFLPPFRYKSGFQRARREELRLLTFYVFYFLDSNLP